MGQAGLIVAAYGLARAFSNKLGEPGVSTTLPSRCIHSVRDLIALFPTRNSSKGISLTGLVCNSSNPLTKSTSNSFVRETFWNFYHRIHIPNYVNSLFHSD